MKTLKKIEILERREKFARAQNAFMIKEKLPRQNYPEFFKDFKQKQTFETIFNIEIKQATPLGDTAYFIESKINQNCYQINEKLRRNMKNNIKKCKIQKMVWSMVEVIVLSGISYEQ